MQGYSVAQPKLRLDESSPEELVAHDEVSPTATYDDAPTSHARELQRMLADRLAASHLAGTGAAARPLTAADHVETVIQNVSRAAGPFLFVLCVAGILSLAL